MGTAGPSNRALSPEPQNGHWLKLSLSTLPRAIHQDVHLSPWPPSLPPPLPLM